MPNKIIIIRHGESEKDKSNPLRGLTEKGKKQIAETGVVLKKLAANQSVEIISSTTPRAVQTAEIFAKALEAPFTKRFCNLRVENIEQVSRNQENLTAKYFEAFAKKALPFKVPSPRAMVRRFLDAVGASNAEIVIIAGHSGALEAFAAFQTIFTSEKKLERELKYGEFIVLTREKC